MSYRSKQPRRPVGSGAKAEFFQWVWDRLALELRFNNSPTVKFNQTTRGITADAGGGGRGSSVVSPFQIIETGDLTYQVMDVPSLLITSGGLVDLSATLDTDFAVTASVAENWFYVDIADATTAVITTSDTVVTWTDHKIPIGYVDTTVDPPEIHQFLHDNIYCPCIT